MGKYDSLINEENAIKLANFVDKVTANPEEVKKMSTKMQNGNYYIYCIDMRLDSISDDINIFLYLITDIDDNILVPVQPILHSKNDDIDPLIPEVYKNGLCLSMLNGSLKLINLKKNNFDKEDNLLPNSFIYSFEDAFTNENFIFGINNDNCIVYDVKKKKSIFLFDKLDYDENYIYGFYFDPKRKNHYVILKFNDDMKLVNSEIDDIVGDRMVTFIIPKNMLIDKKTVLDYTNNLYRDYENLNYIDAEKLRRSQKYTQ